MKKILLSACAALLLPFGSAAAGKDITAPAYPLVSVDPYFSIWSFTDNAYEKQTVHWTGKPQPMISAIRVDGTVYRTLGKTLPRVECILPTVSMEKWTARYTVDSKPAGDWTAENYDDSSWTEGPGAFGSRDMPCIGTEWKGNDRDIWVRRSVVLDRDLSNEDVYFEYSHDDVFELYINGTEVANTGNTWKNHIVSQVPEEIRKGFKKGSTVTFAAHCHNTIGGSYVDFGMYLMHPEAAMEQNAEQLSVKVLPTNTVYSFRCGGVDLEMSFTAPLLLEDIELCSRPVNYVNWKVKSNDGKTHSVQLYYEASPQIAVNEEVVPVVSELGCRKGISYAKTGTVAQPVLATKGDDVRIDWGYFHIASPEGKGHFTIGDYYGSKLEFARDGKVSCSSDRLQTGNFVLDRVALSYTNDLGNVGKEEVCDYLMLAYDDIYSLKLFGKNLRPYWNRNGDRTIYGELRKAADDYSSLMERCSSFDREMLAEAEEVGGHSYAQLCALAYRQSICAHKLAQAPNGDLLFISKENFSCGCAATVDVTYPSAPLFLRYNPEFLKGMLNPIFLYSESGRWEKPFAAHDMGTYPILNGQTYGGNMPVEECGNMVVLTGAIAAVEGNAQYAAKHWDILTQWTDYLVEHGQDPANQLCTDDFAGHFAHNTNLSIKAIEGVASYAMLADMLSLKDVAEKYHSKAVEMARIWKENAFDGDHYRLTFDKSGTWSQKYNLVWDRMLGLNVFDEDIIDTEIRYYLGKQNKYGLPLDSRKGYTKTDWIMWTATMARDKATFEKFIDPLFEFFDKTEVRVPMSDFIQTFELNNFGFRARSVVGGYFIKMIDEMLKKNGHGIRYTSCRPAPEDRLFSSSSVDVAISEVQGLLKPGKLSWMFGNCFPNTLDTTVHYSEDENGQPDTFVYTGDIHAMWLRDSGAQVWPYVQFAKDDAELRRLIAGVINRQFSQICIDPYANAFNCGPTGGEWQSDRTKMNPWLHERKWELDSQCYPIRLAYEYWKVTGDVSVFSETWVKAMRSILDTMREQQRKEGHGSYTFERKTERQLDTKSCNGLGNPCRPCGLIASSFRPSDDACTFEFLVPSNFFAVSVLRKAAEILKGVNGEYKMADECLALANEVEDALYKYAVVKHPVYGKIYAYEIDGYGNALLMDDSNAPSLLSLPYLCDVKSSDRIYRNTRRFVLSGDNPYFFKGTAAEGIGGPHVGYDMIWPMSIIMRALTSTDDKEIEQCIRTLVNTDAGTGFMHESFHKDNPVNYTRPWFAWANTLFGELVLKLVNEGKTELLDKCN